MKRTVLLVAAALLASAAVVMTAGAAPNATEGVTANTVLLEGTFPLTGPAALYAPIPAAMRAYFSYANAHKLAGRQIIWKYSDDGYNPANTVQVTHQEVEQDHAFALVGGLGTEPQTEVRPYLKQQ
jgi:branched-chain amino acid transport system substrate-binding protein